MSVKDFDEYVREALANLSAESNDGNTSDEEMRTSTSSSIPRLLMERYDQGTEPFENFIIRLEAFFELQNIPEEKKVKALISLLHPNLFSLVKDSLFPQPVDKLSYEELKSKLTELLNLKPRVIPSRRKFFNRKQMASESISQYVNELRKLIGFCEYPSEMVDMMLRDVFVCGIRSEEILNTLLNRDNISLESTLQLAKSLEKKELDEQEKRKSNSTTLPSTSTGNENKSGVKSQHSFDPPGTQRCGDFDKPSSSQVRGASKQNSPNSNQHNSDSSDPWNTHSKSNLVNSDPDPWDHSDDSTDSWGQPVSCSRRCRNDSNFRHPIEELPLHGQQRYKTSTKPSPRSNEFRNTDYCGRSSTNHAADSWDRPTFSRGRWNTNHATNSWGKPGTSRTTDFWNFAISTSRQTGRRGGRGGGRLRNHAETASNIRIGSHIDDWDDTPINLPPTSSIDLPPNSNQDRRIVWPSRLNRQSATNTTQNLSTSNESRANKNSLTIENHPQTVSSTSNSLLMRAPSHCNEWDNAPVNLSTNNPNVDQSTTQGTNSVDSRNSLGPGHSSANTNNSEGNQPSTSVPNSRNNSIRNSTKSVSNGRSNLLNSSRFSCFPTTTQAPFYTSILPDSIPMKGHLTENCHVSLPGSTLSKNSLVTLDWYLSTDCTEEGILKALSCDNGNLILSLKLSEVKGIFLPYDGSTNSSMVLRTFNDKDNKCPLVINCYSTSASGTILDHIFIVWERIRKMATIAPKSIWATKATGELYVSEMDSLRSKQQTIGGRYMKEYGFDNPSTPFQIMLPNGLPRDAEITVSGLVPTNAERFHVNLICRHNQEIALHFNPRFPERVIVRNSFIEGEWKTEERNGNFNITKGALFTLSITCMEKKFKIILNRNTYIYFNHRVSPEQITDIEIGGEVIIDGILYECANVIMDAQDLIWEKKCNNLRLLETCSKGVTWGIDTIGMPVVYLNKCHGDGYLLAVEPIKMKDLTLNVLDDDDVAVWAIDEKGKVFYRHGVTTNYVKGTKWENIPSESMISISGEGKQIWCCGENGICYVRYGITATSLHGEYWAPVMSTNGCIFRKIAVGKGTVWGLDCKGDLYVRKEISPLNPKGVYWSRVFNNDNNKFEHVFISDENVWGVTELGVICRRTGITVENPEGVAWSHGNPQNWIHVCEK